MLMKNLNCVQGRAGFTLTEMVVVVALTASIAAIGIRVGSTMVDSGRASATQDVLRVLDRSVDEYINATGSIPPAIARITLEQDLGTTHIAGDTVFYPVIDGRIEVVIPGSDPARNYQINSIGLYLNSIKRSADISSLLESIDGDFTRNYNAGVDPASPGQDLDLQPEMLTVFDSWGNPIRYVHPKFDGIIEQANGARRGLGEAGGFLDVFDTTNSGPGLFTAEYLPANLADLPFNNISIRRNKILRIDQEEARTGGLSFPVETDSDGGVCPSQRPYFYSCGPDGDPATIEDNIYSTTPKFVDPL